MKNLDNLCMNCFEELTQGSVCANCDYDNDTQTSFVYLQPKTILNDRYAIGAFVSHESDAATYMAYDMQELKVVTVREFLPKGIAARLEGSVDVHVRERFKPSFDKLKNSFIRLWETISELKNLSAVIPTYDVFELNSTAYAVSEYMETISLREFLLRNPDGNILWDQARIMFMPVLTTLEALHSKGIIHGGICPDNLVLCRDGKVRLKSFCIAEITHRQDSALQMQAIFMADLPIQHKMFLNRELQLLKAVWPLLQQLQVQRHLRILSKLLHRQATTLYQQKQFTAYDCRIFARFQRCNCRIGSRPLHKLA